MGFTPQFIEVRLMVATPVVKRLVGHVVKGCESNVSIYFSEVPQAESKCSITYMELYMRTLKRSTCLNEIKYFHESGYIDWHISLTIWAMMNRNEEENGMSLSKPRHQNLSVSTLYAVVLMNDDYTPMDFVIEILQQYFALNLDQATQVMLTVHYEGKGVARRLPERHRGNKSKPSQ